MPTEETRTLRHNRALNDIVKERFAFPTNEYPMFRTHVNIPRPVMGVRSADGSIHYPDIVVVEFPHNEVKIIGEVETYDTVTEETAEEKWRPYSQVGVPFYLYVPLEAVDNARDLLKQYRIKVAGLRSWRYVVGQQNIDLVNIIDANRPVEFGLMPAPVLRFIMEKIMRRQTSMVQS